MLFYFLLGDGEMVLVRLTGGRWGKNLRPLLGEIGSV